jgi:hypothetical protein
MRNVTQKTTKEGAGSLAVFHDDIKVYEVKDTEFVKSIQLAFMFLTNLTMDESGQSHVLGLDGDIKLKGAIMENFFGMFMYFKESTEFDFMANVLSNVSSHKVGREFLLGDQG